MKLRHFSLLTLVIGVLLSAFGAAFPLVVLSDQNGSAGIGIIGGADTPTYMDVLYHYMNGVPFCVLVFGITLTVSALFCLIFSKTVKSCCSVKTTALSLGLSSVGAAGLVCFFVWFVITTFHEMSKYPIEYPVSIIAGLACFFVFVALIAVYLLFRTHKRSFKGFCIDVLTCVVYLPAFLVAFFCLYEHIS